MQGEWNLATTRAAESQSAVHEWWAVANNLNKALEAVHNSHSWRLTSPLRTASRAARRLGELPPRLARRTSRSLRLGAKSLLLGTMRTALSHPGLTAGALRFLAQRPRLKQSLHLLASRAGLIQRHSAQAPPARAPVSADQLAPRAARIHAQLEKAVEESKD
jgi:hypothetical protein